MDSFTLGDAITDEQQRFLDTHGFIRFEGFLSQAETDAVLGWTQDVERRWIAEKRTKAFGTPIKFGKDEQGQPFVNRFAFTSVYSPELSAFLADQRFERIRSIFGGEFRLGEREKDGVVTNHYFNREGSRYKQLGWHTDGLRDVFFGHELRPLWQVGLYLDDSPIEKGGLRVIPGSHRQTRRQQLFRKAYFLDHRPDKDEVCIVAKRGDLTIHDGNLWHRVARATVAGEPSRRRVMYIPFVDGPKHERNEKSPTPLYHYLQRITG